MLSPVTEWLTNCRRCGADLMPEAAFCAQCGQAVERTFAQEPPPPGTLQLTRVNHGFVALLIVATVFGVAYHLTHNAGMIQTYAVFVGLPLLIGVLTAYLTRPRSGLGAVIKYTTVILCAVCPALGEGAVCILMAAPIFYGVAILGYYLTIGIAKHFGPRGNSGTLCLVLLPWLVARMTSTPEAIARPKTMTTTRTVFVAAPPDRVWKTLQRSELVSPSRPLFLRLGFPRPTKWERVDGTSRLTFDPGSEPWPGTNVIESREVVDARAQRLTFVIERDGTKLSRWLTFIETRFEVTPIRGGCRLRQTTIFRQRMQPGFYWNSLQRYALGQMHRYALEAIRTKATAAAQ